MSRFTEILTVSPLPNGRSWVLRKPFGYDVGHEDSGETIEVPAGFTTDFASIPRFLWSILPCWGKYGNAHGDRVVEVKRWKRWDVGVVNASFGTGGAQRGEWYYEKNTGFLVGGSKSTALSVEGGGLHFVLIESNLENL
ncbi:MAG: DUF1353 domain-containing protein [Verrucomicrobia bacterium]|nr:DUF1353 domain-containing protein [Verrucomicrobiota bacterium]MBU4428326.1 DUF1353 domain-containing protein [Verrucomicrobiota bacterium]MCG2681091.1 DUF1353 domain-containing protein [Kiritimatiellia bacterium]